MDSPQGDSLNLLKKYGIAAQDLMLPDPDTVSCKFSNLRDNTIQFGDTTKNIGHLATATCGDKTYEMAFASGKLGHNYTVKSKVNGFTITWNSEHGDHGNSGFGKYENVRVSLTKEVNGITKGIGDGRFSLTLGPMVKVLKLSIWEKLNWAMS